MGTDNIPEGQRDEIVKLAKRLDTLIGEVLESDPDPMIEPNYLQRLHELFEQFHWIDVV